MRPGQVLARVLDTGLPAGEESTLKRVMRTSAALTPHTALESQMCESERCNAWLGTLCAAVVR
jgi:hypothetical protein